MNNLLTPGTILHNRYRIIRLLGQGGMGAVYLAEDLHLPGRLIAIKENFDPSRSAQEQFKREAVMLARLKHPNLPQVTDHFIEPSGRQYLVMDYVEGEDLDQILARRGPLPEAEVLGWMEQVFDALEYMHTWVDTVSGKPTPVIHRDIKPGNIKRTPEGRIMLVDFGIAKYQTGAGTETGARAASPGFSPVEQYTGGTDVRSDVYALGATLYCLLTGQVPPESPRIAAGMPLTPPRALNPRISPNTEQAILRAMQIQAANRYQTVRDLRQALTRKTVPPPLWQRCIVCGAANRATAKFCSVCGAALAAVPAPPPPSPVTAYPSPPLAAPAPLPLPPVPSLLRLWTIPLSGRLDEAKARLFNESRKGLVNNIVRSILKEDCGITGITIMLRGIEGFGGTSIATRVKDDILSSRKAVTLVAAVDFSDPGHLAEPAKILEEILMALKRGSGPIGRKLRNAVKKAYRQQMKAKRPATREIETKRRTSFTPFPISLEIVTPWGKTSLGSPYARETQISEREVSEPLDAEQWSSDLLQTLKELIDYLLSERVPVILIFDKVKDIGVLRPLDTIVARGGIYSIVVANMDDYAVWRQQNSDLLKRFSKKDFYVPCIWNLPQQLCRSLTRGVSEADSHEFYLFQKFLEYRGRGVPDRTLKELDQWLHPSSPKFHVIMGWLKRVLRIEHPGQIAIREAQWPEVVRCADIQRRLEAGWPQIFDPQRGIPPLEVLSEQTADRARQAIYTLTDWLFEQAEQGIKVSKQTVTDCALAKCKMPFDERVSKHVVVQFIDFLVQEGKVTPTSRGLDLSGLLTTSPFSDQPRSANRMWGKMG